MGLKRKVVKINPLTLKIEKEYYSLRSAAKDI